MLETIISGGQSGADFAGLIAGQVLGLTTGGTAPKGWRILLKNRQESSNPMLVDFGLTEDPSREWQPRTRKNVADSDGTLWVGYTGSGGAILTLNTAVKLNKPYIINPHPRQLKTWVETNNIKILNVAGNADAPDSNIFRVTFDTIYGAFANGSGFYPYSLEPTEVILLSSDHSTYDLYIPQGNHRFRAHHAALPIQKPASYPHHTRLRVGLDLHFPTFNPL